VVLRHFFFANELKKYIKFISGTFSLQASSGAPLPFTDWTLSGDDREFFTINLVAPLASGQEYHISVNFVGILNNDGFGFFRSIYFDENLDTQ